METASSSSVAAVVERNAIIANFISHSIALLFYICTFVRMTSLMLLLLFYQYTLYSMNDLMDVVRLTQRRRSRRIEKENRPNRKHRKNETISAATAHPRRKVDQQKAVDDESGNMDGELQENGGLDESNKIVLLSTLY